jgi:hypothetical protein
MQGDGFDQAPSDGGIDVEQVGSGWVGYRRQDGVDLTQVTPWTVTATSTKKPSSDEGQAVEAAHFPARWDPRASWEPRTAS